MGAEMTTGELGIGLLVAVLIAGIIQLILRRLDNRS